MMQYSVVSNHTLSRDASLILVLVAFVGWPSATPLHDGFDKISNCEVLRWGIDSPNSLELSF